MRESTSRQSNPQVFDCDDVPHLAVDRFVFLEESFGARSWSVILTRAEDEVLQPVPRFRTSFLIAVVFSLGIVLLVSGRLVRRTMAPLDELKKAAGAIERGKLDARVSIQSDDEFGELAEAFNGMTDKLAQQISTLETLGELDRAILGNLSIQRIVDSVLERLDALIRVDAISLTLVDLSASDQAQTIVQTGDRKSHLRLDFSSQEADALLEHGRLILLDSRENTPTYLQPLIDSDCVQCLVLPMVAKRTLLGFVSLGLREGHEAPMENLVEICQLVDRVAIALANAWLVEELNQLSRGTLQAFARAIDAKSSWTAGHSERVTRMALKIGRALGLEQSDLQIMERGGLLHDIGKLAIPLDILDKPGRLTPDELRVIQEHPVVGARILEPIGAYKSALPIVRHHHERFDGKGYPDRLAGTEIHLHARIFAVADTYDAMISDRPYRSGMPQPRAVEIIRREAGRQFDPTVVEAFLEVMTAVSRTQVAVEPRTTFAS